MQWLKQSTAVTLKIGPFLDASDGDTAETALTISQADVRLAKNGGAFAQKNDATACTHDENGWYGCPLNTTDTGTLGRLQLAVHESGALAVWHECMVLPANVYDALVAGSDQLEVDATLIEGADASDQVNAACDTALADYDGPTKAEMDSGFAGLNDVSAAEVNAQCDTALADYDAPTKAEMDSGFAGLNDLSAAQVNAECDTALADYDAATKAEMDAAFAALNDLSAAEVNAQCDTAIADASLATAAALATVDGNVDAILADTGTDGVIVAELKASALADLFDTDSGTTYGAAVAGSLVKETADNAGGSALTLAEIADAVWDEAAAGHTDAGKAGRQLWTDVDAILADTGSDGVAVAAASKTGYKLAPDGFDSITTTAPSGVASNFREMVVQLWRRFFQKATMTSTQLKTYADDGSTPVTTQTISDDGTTQTQGAAS